MEEVESYYDKKSESYDEIFGTLYFSVYDAVTWKYLEPHVPSDPNALVLDAGGGTARWAIRMAEKGCNVVLMDSSERMLNAAAKKVKGSEEECSVDNFGAKPLRSSFVFACGQTACGQRGKSVQSLSQPRTRVHD
jgi:ubiquinone/menaquinone biosynthesis C-methylase UbiE